MRKAKVKKIVLSGYGSFLGMEKGCFIVRDKHDKVQKYPLFEEEIGEVVLKTGNMVSVGALASLGFWEVDTLILTRRGEPVATLKSLEYDSHAKIIVNVSWLTCCLCRSFILKLKPTDLTEKN